MSRRGPRVQIVIPGTLLLVGLAVVQELRKPPSERSWHGRVLRVVPYDLRPPTLARVKVSVWNPDDPRLLTDRAFGVGWSINFHRLLVEVQGMLGRRTPRS
jgi:hypothetical protein